MFQAVWGTRRASLLLLLLLVVKTKTGGQLESDASKVEKPWYVADRPPLLHRPSSPHLRPRFLQFFVCFCLRSRHRSFFGSSSSSIRSSDTAADTGVAMGCFTVARAITVRVMFTAHGIFSIWRLYVVTNDARNWYLAMALFGLIFETAVTLYKKRGQDWKWQVTHACLM